MIGKKTALEDKKKQCSCWKN